MYGQRIIDKISESQVMIIQTSIDILACWTYNNYWVMKFTNFISGHILIKSTRTHAVNKPASSHTENTSWLGASQSRDHLV